MNVEQKKDFCFKKIKVMSYFFLQNSKMQTGGKFD